VFHFNKKHLEDPTIPMWVLKFHGETLYVNHVDCEVPWSTKETPENPHTKGSIKVRDVLLTIDDANSATLTKLTIFDKVRLRNQRLGITRVIFSPHTDFHTALKNNEFRHSAFKIIQGACSSDFVICDLLDKKELTLAALKYSSQFRVLMPNESYYRSYDDTREGNIPVDYGHPDTPYEYS
jgi:hypothetical protein